MAADAFSAIFLIIITIFIPPLGVFFISGCSADLLINICLTCLGYFPGHIHAFYCEYVYYDRRARGHQGRIASNRAPGIFSERIQNGGDMTADYYYPSAPAQTPATGYDGVGPQTQQTAGWTR